MVDYYSSKFDDSNALFDYSVFDVNLLNVSEFVSSSDSIVKDSSKVVSESVLFSDGGAKQVFRKLFEVVDLNESVSKGAKKFLIEDIGLSDGVVKKVFMNLSDDISLGDLVNKVVGKVLSEDVSLVDDVSLKFFYEYDADVSLSDSVVTEVKDFSRLMRDDLSFIYNDFPWASVVTWVRYVRTEDEFGRSSLDTVSFSKNVNLIVQPLSEKDRSVLVLGESVSGYMKAYAKREYEIDGSFVGFSVGDFVTFKGKVFVVEKVEGRFGGFSEVFSKLILRCVDND